MHSPTFLPPASQLATRNSRLGLGLSPKADKRHQPNRNPQNRKRQRLFPRRHLDEARATGHVCMDQINAGVVDQDPGGDAVDDTEGDEGAGGVGGEGGVDGDADGDSEGGGEGVGGDDEDRLDWNSRCRLLENEVDRRGSSWVPTQSLEPSIESGGAQRHPLKKLMERQRNHQARHLAPTRNPQRHSNNKAVRRDPDFEDVQGNLTPLLVRQKKVVRVLDVVQVCGGRVSVVVAVVRGRSVGREVLFGIGAGVEDKLALVLG